MFDYQMVYLHEFNLFMKLHYILLLYGNVIPGLCFLISFFVNFVKIIAGGIVHVIVISGFKIKTYLR